MSNDSHVNSDQDEAARIEAAFWHDALTVMTDRALDVYRREQQPNNAWASVSGQLRQNVHPTRKPRRLFADTVTRWYDCLADMIESVLGFFASLLLGVSAVLTKWQRKKHSPAHVLEYPQFSQRALLSFQAISSDLENLISNECGRQEMSKQERERALKTSLSQVHVLSMLIEDAENALFEHADRPLVFRRHCVRPILDDCVSVFEGFAIQSNVRLNSVTLCSGDEEFPDIEMSRPHLARAFKGVYYNALENARSAHRTEPEVRWISTQVTSVDEGDVVVTIDCPFEMRIMRGVSSCNNRFARKLAAAHSRINFLGDAMEIINRHGGRTVVENACQDGITRTIIKIVLPHCRYPRETYDDRRENVQAALG